MRLAAAIEENAYLRIDAGAAVSLEINGVLKREPVGPGGASGLRSLQRPSASVTLDATAIH